VAAPEYRRTRNADSDARRVTEKSEGRRGRDSHRAGVKGSHVRIGIKAPKDVAVHREEVYDRIQRGSRSVAGPNQPHLTTGSAHSTTNAKADQGAISETAGYQVRQVDPG
jgi:hypothetical protein